MQPRHIYAAPLIKPSSALLEMGIPIKHRPPNLLPVEYVENGKSLELYQLFEDYSLVYGGKLYTEPKGRLVDGASVPRFAWGYAPPDGRHRRSAFWHDVFYATKVLPKAAADTLFYNLLIEDGVGKTRAWIMYRAVHHFGDPSKSVSRWSELLYPQETEN